MIARASEMKVATSQFPVSGNVARNLKYISRHIRAAATQGSRAILFPEGSLSGYGRHMISFDQYDWGQLRRATHDVLSIARAFKIWVFLGSAHFLSSSESPMNCLYIVSPEGIIIDRYDKSMLFGHDLERYTSGNHPVVLDIGGWPCGFAICYDSHFPELFARYRELGVKILFLSMNCSGLGTMSTHMKLLIDLVPAQFRTRAMDNRMWIISANSSAAQSCAPSMIARPDGSIRTNRRNRAGLLYHCFPDTNTGLLYNDKMIQLSENEVFHNGRMSTHPRAVNRQSAP